MSNEPVDALPRSLRVSLDEPGPAAPQSEAARRRMARRIIAAARSESAPPPEARRTPRRSSVRTLLVAAAALLSVCAVAMAATLSWPRSDADTPRASVPTSTETRSKRASTTPSAPTQELEARAPTAEPSAAAPARLATVPPASNPRPRTTRSADDGLAAANALRRDRRWAAAERAYLAVVRRFPATEQAYTARLAAADLQLAHTGRPALALAGYRAALSSRPGGALAAHARFGITRALRRLGRREAERSALENFLAAHPDDLRAAAARARLAALGPPTE